MMFKYNLKNKFYLLTTLFFTIIFLVWIAFYYVSTRHINKITQTQLNHTAAQIVSDLENEFSYMERLVFTSMQNATVKDFISEDHLHRYYDKALLVNDFLQASASDQAFIKYVILYNESGTFYRFFMSAGNTASKKIFYTITPSLIPEHLIIETEEGTLIGYGSNIYNNTNERIGAIAVLVDGQTILNRLKKYDADAFVHVAVTAKNQVLISNIADDLFLEPNTLKKNAFYYTDRTIGITPFTVIVTADSSYLVATNIYFTLAALITALAFTLLLVSFSFSINQHFLRPILSIIKSVDDLDISQSSQALPYVKNIEFNKLILKVNELLDRIEAKNIAFSQAQISLKNAEITKQRAVIFSLKKQINAHFTINSLNIIHILIEKCDIKKACMMCEGLSMLIRYAHDEDPCINAWEEFDVLQNYIHMMNIRYENKFVVEFDVDDRLMDYKIPRMLLQPIVENALLHGYKAKKTSCPMEIVAAVVDGAIVIHMRDYGVGIPPTQLSQLLEGLNHIDTLDESAEGIEQVALVNIQRRIKSYYGSQYGLSISSEEGCQTIVTLTLGLSH